MHDVINMYLDFFELKKKKKAHLILTLFHYSLKGLRMTDKGRLWRRLSMLGPTTERMHGDMTICDQYQNPLKIGLVWVLP